MCLNIQQCFSELDLQTHCSAHFSANELIGWDRCVVGRETLKGAGQWASRTPGLRNADLELSEDLYGESACMMGCI